MRVPDADYPFTLHRMLVYWALSRFHIETLAAERDAERHYHRALIDRAMGRATFCEMYDATDVALAQPVAEAGSSYVRATSPIARISRADCVSQGSRMEGRAADASYLV